MWLWWIGNKIMKPTHNIRKLKFQGDDWMEHCKVVEISHTCLYMDVMKVAISWEIRIWIGSLSIVRGCPPLLSPCTVPLPIQILYPWYLDPVDMLFYLHIWIQLQLLNSFPLTWRYSTRLDSSHTSSHKCPTANNWIRMWIHTSVNARLVITTLMRFRGSRIHKIGVKLDNFLTDILIVYVRKIWRGITQYSSLQHSNKSREQTQNTPFLSKIFTNRSN